MRTGGVADFLIEVYDVNDLVKAASLAYQFNLPYTVLGAGNSVLPSDVGYPGLIIVNRAEKYFPLSSAESFVVEGGASCSHLASYAASRSYSGLEILAAFPGTIAGAVLTNAYWNQRHARSLLKGLTLWRPKGEEGEIITLTEDRLGDEIWPNFLAPNAYRPIILTLQLRVARTSAENAMGRLVNFYHSISRERKEEARLGHLFTKNLAGNINYHKLLPRHLWQGMRIGKDPNVLENPRRQTSSAVVRQVITVYRKALEEKLGLALAERVNYLGYWPDGESISSA